LCFAGAVELGRREGEGEDDEEGEDEDEDEDELGWRKEEE
jgi:hypothetical protein